jgi:hypothetical protein
LPLSTVAERGFENPKVTSLVLGGRKASAGRMPPPLWAVVG